MSKTKRFLIFIDTRFFATSYISHLSSYVIQSHPSSSLFSIYLGKSQNVFAKKYGKISYFLGVTLLLRDFRNGVMGSSPSGITTQKGGLQILKDFPKFPDDRWGNIGKPLCHISISLTHIVIHLVAIVVDAFIRIALWEFCPE